MALCFELERLRREADAARDELRALLAPLSEAQLCWRPAPGKWTLAEIATHLTLTAQLCLPAVDRALEEAERRGWRSLGPFRLTPMGHFFVWYVEPPPAIRLPAPRPLVPPPECSPREALPEFLRWQEEVVDRMERASGYDLNRARFRSPFAKFVTMDLLAVFSVFTAHERRHIWQARNLLAQMPQALAGEAGS